MKPESEYMRNWRLSRRLKLDIQVNSLRYQISLQEFKIIAKILRLEQLGIQIKPALTFSVYNLGIKKIKKQANEEKYDFKRILRTTYKSS